MNGLVNYALNRKHLTRQHWEAQRLKHLNKKWEQFEKTPVGKKYRARSRNSWRRIWSTSGDPQTQQRDSERPATQVLSYLLYKIRLEPMQAWQNRKHLQKKSPQTGNLCCHPLQVKFCLYFAFSNMFCAHQILNLRDSVLLLSSPSQVFICVSPRLFVSSKDPLSPLFVLILLIILHSGEALMPQDVFLSLWMNTPVISVFSPINLSQSAL